MLVKICGITNREDALAAVEGSAGALGFNFYSESPRYIRPEAAAQISELVPEYVLKVGVFVNETPVEVARLLREAGLDLAQLHGNETAETVPGSVRIWKAFRVTPQWHAGLLEGFQAEAFVLDAAPDALFGGSGETFDWSSAQGIHKKIVLAGGLDASNVALAIQTARPWGVDACSRLEKSPGRKDHGKMLRFLRAAQMEYL
ncbi:MAG: phosphoribosylanthranilate isomerase [Bryobacteraceae bacterium]